MPRTRKRKPTEAKKPTRPQKGSRTEKLMAAKRQLERKLMLDVTSVALAASSGTEKYGFENIVGVGISEKLVAGKLTAEPCVTVYVVAKAPKDAVEKKALVPEKLNGIQTDVVETGEFLAFPFRGRYRPASPGVSIGHYQISAGTFGCLARKNKDLFILSNNHVLANENRGKPGDPILQPGPYDGGRNPQDLIGYLRDYVDIVFGGGVNRVDCAIAKVSPKDVSSVPKCYGGLRTSPQRCELNLPVKKCGRTTQFTRGRVTDCHATVRVGYDQGLAVFQDQILIQSQTQTPFGEPGDSGSLIVTDVGSRPVGLLFAGSRTYTVANPIEWVLSELGVQIVVQTSKSK